MSDSPPQPERRPVTPDEAILMLTAARGPQKSICPTEAARLYGGEERWRSVLGEIRKAAVRLALAGAIDITRKGRPADPLSFKGVYRLRMREPESAKESE